MTRGSPLYQILLVIVLCSLFVAAAILGYKGLIPLDWIRQLSPDSGGEVVIVAATCAAVILILVVALGRSGEAAHEPARDLPTALSQWSQPQPTTEWSQQSPPLPGQPTGFLTRPSTPMGRPLAPYLGFYQLSEPPFSMVPDPRFLVLSERYLSAIPMLRPTYSHDESFVILVADAGCGKTTILKHLQRMGDARTITGFIPGITAQSKSIYGWLMHAFSISPSNAETVEAKERVRTFISAQSSIGKKVHLFLDEAQALTPEMLLELHELVNAPEFSGKVRVTLAGLPALRATLQDEALRPLKASGYTLYEMPHLSFEETNNYIERRLSIAGATRSLFSETAKETIFYFSLGRPGLINMLCELALSYGATDRRETISFQTILDIIEDRSSSGLTPFRTTPGSEDKKAVPGHELPA